jgi:hypothetical protein
MADLPETLESVVRRTRGYIQLLKQENSDLLEWQGDAMPLIRSAFDQLKADGHDELAQKLWTLWMRADE